MVNNHGIINDLKRLLHQVSMEASSEDLLILRCFAAFEGLTIVRYVRITSHYLVGYDDA